MESEALQRLIEAVEQARAKAADAAAFNPLLDCYGTAWRDDPQFLFEHHHPDGGFADLLWKGVVLIEMKSKSERNLAISSGELGYSPFPPLEPPPEPPGERLFVPDDELA